LSLELEDDDSDVSFGMEYHDDDCTELSISTPLEVDTSNSKTDRGIKFTDESTESGGPIVKRHK
jgi:hypothetical protein